MESHSFRGNKMKNSNDLRKSNGINVITACLFIVGEIAGTGILAFPDSMKGMNWFGVLVILFGGIMAAYAGVVLAQSWLTLEENHPDLTNREATRDPYSFIGSMAYGRWGRWMTSFTLVLMLFGSSVVQILVCAETLQSLIPSVPINFCHWIVLVGIILMPFTFLGSPVDFQPIAYFAMSSTSFACVLIIISICLEADPASTIEQPLNATLLASVEDRHDISYISVKSVLLGIATVIFGYGGTSVLPTIQNDMKDKKKFPLSIIVAFSIMILLYLPVSSIAFWKFGNGVKSNVMRNLTHSPLVTGINVLIVSHVCCAFLIQINPVNLTCEAVIGVHDSFNFKRCSSRAVIASLAILTGLTIPKFGKLLNFLGSFAVSLQSFVLPAVFYLKLCPEKRMTLIKKLVLVGIIFFGLFIAVVSTIYSLIELMHPDSFTQPCFVNDCIILD